MLNAEQASTDKVASNKELQDIVSALGQGRSYAVSLVGNNADAALKSVDPAKLDAEHKRTYEIFQREAVVARDEVDAVVRAAAMGIGG